jgi:tetratricopeptide (TPR) repeat protein
MWWAWLTTIGSGIFRGSKQPLPSSVHSSGSSKIASNAVFNGSDNVNFQNNRDVTYVKIEVNSRQVFADAASEESYYLNIYRKLQETSADKETSIFAKANRLFKDGDFASPDLDIHELLRASKKQNQQTAFLAIVRGNLQKLASVNVKPALPLFSEAYRLEPDEFIFSLPYAMALIELDRHGDAREPLDKAAQSLRSKDLVATPAYYSALTEVLRLLAGCYKSTDQNSLVIETINEQVSLLRPKWEMEPQQFAEEMGIALASLASAYSRDARNEEADRNFAEAFAILRDVETVAALRGAMALAKYEYATHLIENRKIVEAEAAVAAAIDLWAPLAQSDRERFLANLANGHGLRGQCFEKEKRLAEAEGEYLKAIELVGHENTVAGRNTLVVGYDSLGKLYGKTNRKALQEDAFNKCVSLLKVLVLESARPFDILLASALGNLGQFYCDTKRPIEGKRLLDQALKILKKPGRPLSSIVSDTLAFVHTALGSMYRQTQHVAQAELEFNEAILSARESIRIDPRPRLYRLVVPLQGLRDIYADSKRNDLANKRSAELVDVLRTLSAENGAYKRSLGLELKRFGDSSAECGDTENAAKWYGEATAALILSVDPHSVAGGPELAGSLLEIGRFFGKIECWSDAITAFRAAADIYRMLARTTPPTIEKGTVDFFLLMWDLALLPVLDDLGKCYEESGALELASTTYQDAVTRWQVLHDDHHMLVKEKFANARLSLARLHRKLKKFEEAAAEYKEAAKLLIDLPNDQSDGSLSAIAQIYTEMGNNYLELSQSEPAQKALVQASNVLRHLTVTQPIFYWSLAYVLHDLADSYSDQGCWSLGITAAEESVKILRRPLETEFVEKLADTRWKLVSSLWTLGRIFERAGDHARALNTYSEAVAAFDSLGADEATSNALRHGVLLMTLGDSYRRNQRGGSAQNAFIKSLSVLNTMSSDPAQPHVFWVARVLEKLVDLNVELDRRERATEFGAKRLNACRELAVKDPNSHLASVGDALNALGIVYAEGAEPELAFAAFREALVIQEGLFSNGHAASESKKLAGRLLNVGLMECEFEKYNQAETNISRALELQRRASHSTQSLPSIGLANTLTGFSKLKAMMGNIDEAKVALEECLFLCHEATKPPESPREDVAYVLSEAGNVFLELDDLGAAERLYSESRDAYRQVLTEDELRYNSRLEKVVESLAGLYRKLGDRGSEEVALSEASALKARRDGVLSM